jgi:hypothetical protein
VKLLPLTALLLPIFSACTSGPIAKSELDQEVRRLCAIDGGIKVYEAVRLPAEKFNEWRQTAFRIPPKESVRPGDEYYYEWEIHYYRRGNPEYWRSEHRLVRANDKKVLGTSVRYVRRGGDLPSPAHDSSFSCPEIGRQPSLEQSVFSKGVEE